MEFAITEDARIVEDQVVRFINEKIIPAEGAYAEQAKTTENGADPKMMVDLRAEAKSLGLWNLYLPDEKWGEAVTAVVVLKAETEASEEQIIRFCKGRMAHFKAPKSVDFVPALPTTGSGKIAKSVLREAYWKGQARKVH